MCSVSSVSQKGLSRLSLPSSTVPVEVGDRISVTAKNLLGRVDFIGETHFASGVLVGIVLDHPEGKTNGMVQGIQYFQCPPKHGLFTQPQQTIFIEKTDASIPTNTDLKAEILKLGDSVIVGGIKDGILQFLGPTDFTKGIWAGVELHEAIGGNDGSVSGKR